VIEHKGSMPIQKGRQLALDAGKDAPLVEWNQS